MEQIFHEIKIITKGQGLYDFTDKTISWINDQKINSIPEKDLDRTSTEGKASSVQFIHFNFTNQQILKFKDLKNDIFLGINHKLYNHTIQIPENIKKSLITDFN